MKITILVLQNQDFTISKIVHIIERTREVIYNFSEDPRRSGKKKNCCRSPVLSMREKRAVIRIQTHF